MDWKPDMPEPEKTSAPASVGALSREAGHSDGHGHASGPVRSMDELQRMGYETDDVGVQTIMRWVGLMFAFVAGALVITFAVYKVFVPGDETAQETNVQYPLTSQQRLPPSDAPMLQASPKRDWMDFTREADEKVHTYGWVNPNRGVVKIPVERAMDILVARGLPVQPRLAPQAANGSNTPGSGAVAGAALQPQPGLVGSSNTLSSAPDIGTGSSTYGAR